jgi:hypothetical protein
MVVPARSDANPIAILVPDASKELSRARLTQSEVLDALNSLEMEGAGPEILLSDLVQKTIELHPRLKPDSIRKHIRHNMLIDSPSWQSFGWRNFVRVRPGVIRRV